MTIVAAIILAVLIPPVLFDLAFRPTIRRLALRNVVRRPGEAGLVVGGALLATALITASMIIGNSFGSRVTSIAEARLGPIDEIVYLEDPVEAPTVAASIAELPGDLVDGVISASFAEVAIGSGVGPQINPKVDLLEADPASAVAFSGDPELLGAGDLPAMADDEVVLNETIAEDLSISVGDPVEIYHDGVPVSFTVRAVRPATGLNGLGEVIAAPGAVTGLFEDQTTVAQPVVLVSNVGDVYSGAALTPQVMTNLENLLGPDADISPVKQGLLDDAEFEATDMTTLFGTVGGFSVIAGILLVINLFIMLAGERQSEMGTLRATGLRRGHLVRAFSMEGVVYGVVAAAAGVVVGIGVAALVMTIAGSLFDDDRPLQLAVAWSNLAAGAIIGLAISQLTVVLTSWRITRLNIVRAIRELPAPPSTTGGRRSLIIGGLAILAGVAGYVGLGTDPFIAMIAPTMAALGFIPFLGRLVPKRAATVGCCAAALGWLAVVFGALPEVMRDPDVSLFLIQGVGLVALASVIFGQGDFLWQRAANMVTGGSIASRLGLAEPLARPVRSSLLVSMYALVIFTVTFIAVMNSVFQAQVPEFATQAGGGYEVIADSNLSGGLTATELEATPGVRAAAAVERGWADLTRMASADASSATSGDDTSGDDTSGDGSGDQERGSWEVSAIDHSITGAAPPPLVNRLAGFDSDDELWTAIVAGQPYLIADQDDGFDVGDRYLLIGRTGERTMLTVGGTTEQGWLIDAGLIVGPAAGTELFGDGYPATRFYLDVDEAVDPMVMASELTNNGAAQGVDAMSFEQAAKLATDEQEGFLYLLQAYLALGLLIGTAGLGVVLVRAVRERRRQFGVLRALGVAPFVIRQAFLVEAAFVAFQGVALGIGLGLLSSWQVLANSSAIEADLGFSVPAGALVILGLSCFAASLVMAAVPAIRAARTSPALALRAS